MARHLISRNGIWYFNKKVDGRIRRISLRTADEKAAKRLAADLLAKLERDDEPVARRVPRFEEWWEVYEQTYTVKKRAPRRDREVIKNAMPWFKGKELGRVTRSMCEQYLTGRLSRVAQDTVTREHSFLQGMWQRAIDEGYAINNPWRLIKRKAYSARTRVLTSDEQVALFGKASPAFQRWVRFLVGTGLRLEECRAIRVNSFHPASRADQAPQRIKDSSYVRVTGKGGKTRDVPLLGDSKDAVLEQFEAQGRFWPQSQSYFRKELDRYCRAAKIEHVSPHALRHTFSTRYLQGGGNIYVLSRILGHSSVTTTEKVYVHLLREDLVALSRDVFLPSVTVGCDRGDSSAPTQEALVT